MKMSKLFTKTNRNAKELASKNATLLQKAGFIDQVMAGVYTYLPLGLRVLAKIEQIVREEMDKIGSEVLMPSIVPIELWQATGRFDTVDVLMKTTPANAIARAKHDAEYVLSPTHEDTVTPLAQKFNLSYKDFPFALYQIQTKFRNEPRAKSGLLRCREFRMKDLYSFHTSEEDLKRYYEIAKNAYVEVFKRVGLGADTVIVLASGGDFTKEYSHEFQTRCSAGEDTIFYAQKAGIYYNREVTPSQAPIIDDLDEEIKKREDVQGVGIIGVQELADFLHIPVAKTTKTLLFEDEKGAVIAAAVRGGYDMNEEKLKKVAGVTSLKLASVETVKRVTGAEVGYAGLLNLPKEVRVFMDESMKGRRNFEMGANKTHYHSNNINFGRDLPEPAEFYDIKIAKEGDLHQDTREVYEVFSTAEVGNIFPLNTKFSNAIGYTYTDESGKQQPVYMGSYGIGTGRVMGVLVEKLADEKGLVWPDAVAPFTLHLISLPGGEEHAQDVYDLLSKKGIDVLWDDRQNVSAGVKFADYDLIGIPWRLVVSKKTEKMVEVKKRIEEKTELLTIEKVIEKCR